LNPGIHKLKKKVSKTKLPVFIICLLSLFTACKINYSLNGASIPPEAKTVSVKYFENSASLAPPTLSQKFSEALRDKIISQTRLTLVKTNGDIAFEGSITNYITTPIAIQSTDQAALNRLTITVTVKYNCSFDEKKNYEQAFSRFADYSSGKALSEVESDLITQINDQLVQDIFNKTFNDW
jgi:hypothetical protein